MFDKNYFLNQLRNGEDMEVVAKNIADAMNDALDEYHTECQAQKEHEAHINQRKFDIAQHMVKLIQEYGELCVPEASDIFENYTDDDLKVMMKSLDEMFDLMKSMVQLKNALDVKPATSTPNSDDEVLGNFIKSLM